jgi:hypothetical protein
MILEVEVPDKGGSRKGRFQIREIPDKGGFR